ncbi:MAG: hypothetical protein ACO23R_14560, partial [bacterium]
MLLGILWSRCRIHSRPHSLCEKVRGRFVSMVAWSIQLYPDWSLRWSGEHSQTMCRRCCTRLHKEKLGYEQMLLASFN